MYDNDGRFPAGAMVLIRYPAPGMNAADTRDAWPWWLGSVECQGAPDEWQILVMGRVLGMDAFGQPAPAGTPDEEMYFPLCFRDSSEIRPCGDEPVKVVLIEFKKSGTKYLGCEGILAASDKSTGQAEMVLESGEVITIDACCLMSLAPVEDEPDDECGDPECGHLDHYAPEPAPIV